MEKLFCEYAKNTIIICPSTQTDPSFSAIEACIGVIGIQDICHFTSRDIGYYPFYFQGYRILCSISGILCFLLKKKQQKKTEKTEKTTVKVTLKDKSLKRKRLSERIFDLLDGEFLQTARRLSEMLREITACIYR